MYPFWPKVHFPTLRFHSHIISTVRCYQSAELDVQWKVALCQPQPAWCQDYLWYLCNCEANRGDLDVFDVV